MNQQPSIGHIVHYVSHGTPVREDGTQAFTKQCRAALITEVGGWVTEKSEILSPQNDKRKRRAITQVWNADAVGLTVDNPTGTFYRAISGGSCQYDEGGDVADWSCDGWDHEGGYLALAREDLMQNIDGCYCIRVGRTIGTSLYAQWSAEAVKGDTYLGIFDSRDWAQGVADTMNGVDAGDRRLMALGRLLYPLARLESPTPAGLDDFVGVATSPEMARYLAIRTNG